MLHCAQFVERVTEVEEGGAGVRLRLSFQLHRVVCRYCRRFVRQMRAVRGAMLRAEPRSEGRTPAAINDSSS